MSRMIIDNRLQAALGSDINWVSMRQALLWGINRYETEENARERLEALIMGGTLALRHSVSAQGRYFGGGLCNQVPLRSKTKFGTCYADIVSLAKGLGETVPSGFIDKFSASPTENRKFLWERNAIGFTTPETDECHGRYWTHYGIHLALYQLEEQQIAPRTAFDIRVSRKGRPLSATLPYWIAELVDYLDLNIPNLKSTDAIIYDVNCIIQSRLQSERGLPDDYGTLPDPTLTPWVSLIRQRLMERTKRA